LQCFVVKVDLPLGKHSPNAIAEAGKKCVEDEDHTENANERAIMHRCSFYKSSDTPDLKSSSDADAPELKSFVPCKPILALVKSLLNLNKCPFS
jgi:hypothetical protein